MDKLNTMKTQYIRCMKPNNCLKPAIFENHNIVRQLRHGGVLEAILICNNRYPTREFAHPSAVLAPKVVEGNDDDKALCKRTPDKMGLKGDQVITIDL
ncbi:myosin-17-like [Actinidia eriantha]|nr:myosin-17-like [Actinidia eriantha]